MKKAKVLCCVSFVILVFAFAAEPIFHNVMSAVVMRLSSALFFAICSAFVLMNKKEIVDDCPDIYTTSLNEDLFKSKDGFREYRREREALCEMCENFRGNYVTSKHTILGILFYSLLILSFVSAAEALMLMIYRGIIWLI